jgi:hypothetical protein
MRILCISPFFPPTRDSEAFCSGKMVQALQQQGAEVTTVYLQAPYLRGRQDGSGMWHSLQATSIGLGDPVGRDRARAVGCMLRFRTLVWPRWIGSVVRRAGDLHRAARFDLVYSRSLPMFGHVAGFWASRKLRIPWVANINDPWDEHLFPGRQRQAPSCWHARLSEHWLRKTLRGADLVTFPCARLARFTTRIASVRVRAEIVPHVGTAAAPAERHQEFRLVHAGKLGNSEITGRSSRALLTGLRRFLDQVPDGGAAVRLVLVGPEDAQSNALIEDLGLRAAVRSVGLVSYEQSLSYIAAASACILIEAPMPEGIYLPSKLADYIVAGKPVLALSPRIGTLSDFAGPSLMIVDQGDEQQIQCAFLRLYEDHCQRRMAAPAPTLVDWFSPERIAAHFLKTVSELPQMQMRRAARQSSKTSLPAGQPRFEAL